MHWGNMKYVVLEKYLSPPGIEESRREMWMLFSNENEIQFCSETNPCQHFPGIEEVSELLWDFEVVFRHFVTKLSESKLPHPSDHVRGRANQSFSVRFSEFSVRGGPSKILHPLQRGCQSRLSICQSKEIYKYWDGNAVYVPVLSVWEDFQRD